MGIYYLWEQCSFFRLNGGIDMKLASDLRLRLRSSKLRLLSDDVADESE